MQNKGIRKDKRIGKEIRKQNMIRIRNWNIGGIRIESEVKNRTGLNTSSPLLACSELLELAV